MKIFVSFIISILIFIYGINLFSKSLEKLMNKNIKIILEKYTKTPFKGIIFGTILTSLIQSSTLTTITTVGLVNSGLLTFHNSLGIMMGANLGTCITSWIISLLNISNQSILMFLNPNTYIPILLVISIFYYFKNRKVRSNILLGFSLFMLGLKLMQDSLLPIKDYYWFKSLLTHFNNPIIGVLSGILITTLIQSSSATVAILQTISENNPLTYLIVTPIIMGENIGTCLTTLVASIKTSKNAKKVAYSHLLYNLIGTIIFLILFYIINFLKLNILYEEVNSFKIALIHTLFNFLSIIIFYPFLNTFEKLINKLIKE
ncbi:MAG: Na/Pi cotransporter family protein [Bacilli bacterium]|nr:Na/Pi cotransporter family protein [Bacilli bacterium]